MLAQCTALAHLNLNCNKIGDAGAASLAGVLAQCRALVHLQLCIVDIGAAGAESLAGVLGQCVALTHLNLCDNGIGTVGAGRLRASWRGQAYGLLLDKEEKEEEVMFPQLVVLEEVKVLGYSRGGGGRAISRLIASTNLRRQIGQVNSQR